ncbi:MAG: hypothetical protein KBT34_02870 [Prevotella sp.]|nr:hypothetical protein [Candidatus Prevotella equi]
MLENLDLTAIVASIVSLIGGGWLFNLYSARPRKTSIELENVGKAMDEMNGVIATMKESSRTYREDTDRTIRGLNAKVENLEKAIKVKDEAIYSAYDCPFPQKTSECVVLRVYKQCKSCTVDTEVIKDEDNEGND